MTADSDRMRSIAEALIEIGSDCAVRSILPGAGPSAGKLTAALDRDDPPALESALIGLYILLHNAGSLYAPVELDMLRKRSGYLNHPGGLSPVVMAEGYVKPETVVIDLGAGNGLQGLLLQRLYPHRKTIQVELSGEMIRIGRVFQRALHIGDDRVEWLNRDILEVSLKPADLIYIYRPARPSGSGAEVYRYIADRVAGSDRPLVIMSVADCLGQFLDKSIPVVYSDGHLTCFRREG